MFREQVVKLSKVMRDKKVTHNNINIDWLKDIPSIDNCLYICKTCQNHITQGNLPKLAVANNNELPHVPDFIRTLNDGEERLVAPRTFFES